MVISENLEFENDRHTGRPRVLFIGWPESSHTHSWIDLLNDSEIKVRLFALPSALPPASWNVRTYITFNSDEYQNPANRMRVHPIYDKLPERSITIKVIDRLTGKQYVPTLMSLESVLADVVRHWKPDVTHTLALEDASYFYLTARLQYGLQGIGTWIAHVRGGPELALHRYLPDRVEKIKSVMQNCDQLIADNELNYEYAVELGLDRSKVSELGVVPGTGGMDIENMASRWSMLPSKRERIIIWPKTYEVPTSKALPIFEALKLAWDSIRPCRIYMLWVVQPEITIWFQKMLPQEIRDNCIVMPRISRDEVLDLMIRSRIMLAPSLSDGIPNCMLEAMVCGAFPIVSPIETITPVVKSPENVLFARNLFPQELADALVRAMNDDSMVDAAASKNLGLVRGRADRTTIAAKLVAYYERLAGEK